MRLPIVFVTSAFMLTGLSAASPVPQGGLTSCCQGRPGQQPQPAPVNNDPQHHPGPSPGEWLAGKTSKNGEKKASPAKPPASPDHPAPAASSSGPNHKP